MKELGQPILFIIWRFSSLRGTKIFEEYANGTLENFIMRGFSLLGEFIIGGAGINYMYVYLPSGFCSIG